MMIYNLWCALLALSLFAGGVVAQNDYTIGTVGNPSGTYTASVSGTTLAVTGTYALTQAYDPSAYTQTFYTVATNTCTTTLVTAATAPTATLTGLSLAASFTLSTASLPATIYTGPLSVDNTATPSINEKTTGVVLLCHTIQLKQGALVMNEVKTIVKLQLALEASFTSVTITTTPSTELSGNADLDLATGVTINAVANPSTLRAGQPVKVTLTSPDYQLSAITSAVLTGPSGVTNIIPTPGTNVITANSCIGGECVIDLTLGFSFFAANTVYTLTGKATLDLSSGIRRRLESAPQAATFEVSLVAVAEDTQSSAGLTMVTAAGGLMAVVAIVMV